MQENTLHAWRASDKKDMRMSGYPAKTRSLSWSFDGHWLATSGADAAIIWPFKDKEGPVKKAPLECGARQVKVTCVAFHPKSLVVAQGYEDGLLLLCRISDGAEILVRAAPEGGRAIKALAWDATGRRLLFGAADGHGEPPRNASLRQFAQLRQVLNLSCSEIMTSHLPGLPWPEEP